MEIQRDDMNVGRQVRDKSKWACHPIRCEKCAFGSLTNKFRSFGIPDLKLDNNEIATKRMSKVTATGAWPHRPARHSLQFN